MSTKTGKKTKAAAVPMTPEAFVMAWDVSSSAKEVAEKFAMKAMQASNLAAYMRRKGVKLKRMARGRRSALGINPEALNQLLTSVG